MGALPRRQLNDHVFAVIMCMPIELSRFMQVSFDKSSLKVIILAVQNERQPRNTATIRPETLRDMSAEQERALREAAVAVGVFG